MKISQQYYLALLGNSKKQTAQRVLAVNKLHQELGLPAVDGLRQELRLLSISQ